MIVVDTSVWIEFLRANPSVFSILRTELEKGAVLAVEWVFGELLQGAANAGEIATILGYWKSLPQVSGESIWIHAGELSNKEKLLSKGVGLIDVAILIAARNYDAKLWTFDKKLLSLCSPQERYLI